MGKDKSSGIFSSWLKNFTVMVFTQSFHAIFLMIILKFIAVVSGGSISSGDESNTAAGSFVEKQGIYSIITLAAMTSLIKMEKFIKDLFGIQDSKMLGGISDNFGKAMIGMKSGMDLVKRTKEPFDKHKEAQANLAAKQKAYNRAKARNAAINSAQTSISQSTSLPAESDSINQNVSSQNLDASNVSSSNEYANINGNGNGSGNGTGNGVSEQALNRLIMALENNSQALRQSGGGSGGGAAGNAAAKFDAEEAEQDAFEDLEKAKRDEQAWKRKRVTRLATTVAAGAMGMGATDNLADAVAFANLADKPLDWYTDRKVDTHVNKDAAARLMKESRESQVESDKAAKKESNIQRTRKNLAAYNRMPEKVQNRYNELEKESASAKAAFAKQAQRQSAMAQKFLDDIPKSVIAEMGQAWIDMSRQITPIDVRKNDQGKYRPTIDTSLNRSIVSDVKDIKRSGVNIARRVRGKDPIPRSVDEI